MSQSFTGLAALGFSSKFPGINSSINKENKEGQEIICRQLGKTDIQLPIVNMGVYTTDPALIQAAYEEGVRLFSTCHFYGGGLCEKAIGDAVDSLGIRKSVFIATKIPSGMRRTGEWEKNFTETFLKRLALSMERLKTEYLDILYLYNIRRPEEIVRPELLDLLTDLKNKKKVRYVGFTTHENHEEIINKALEVNFYDAAVVAFNYTMSKNKALLEIFNKAYQKGLGLVAMKTQCGGAWGVHGYRKPPQELKNQTAILKWVLNNDFISTAIPAIETYEHLNEDFSVAYDLNYTNEEKRFLNDENVGYEMAFCLQCKKCLPTCPNGIDIPTLMRIHMYAFQYRNMDLVHLAQQESCLMDNISCCLSCRECQAVCCNSVPIAHNIASLKKLNWLRSEK